PLPGRILGQAPRAHPPAGQPRDLAPAAPPARPVPPLPGAAALRQPRASRRARVGAAARRHPEGHPQGGHHRRDGPRHARRASRIPPHTRPLPPENWQHQASTSIIAIGPARAELRRKSARPVPRGRECSNALPLPDEHETANAQLKPFPRGRGRVLRSQSPDMIEQEIWGYLLAHYAISALICTAATSAGIDPDRVKFKRTIRAVRRRVADPAFPP